MTPDGPPRSAIESLPAGATETLSPETTVELLTLAKAGNDVALNRLVARCLPMLQRWAHGRLPAYVRDAQDTADLVQDTVLAALKHLGRFEVRHEGALQAYLRQALLNRIRDIIRAKRRRPERVELPDNLQADSPTPLEEAIGRQNLERYEAALTRLRPIDRESIILRLELQYRYEELAVALGKPNAIAARVAVRRAIERLIAEMRHGE